MIKGDRGYHWYTAAVLTADFIDGEDSHEKEHLS